MTSPALAADPASSEAVPPALNFKVKSLEGEEVNLADYKGQVLLVVNVASQCGATYQYADLEQMYRAHKDRGLVVLGFPCNQFGGQEPGSAAEIRSFCTKQHSVTFPMFAKIDVNGPRAAPFYQHLTAATTQPQGPGKIGWNFEKFIIGRDGAVVARFPSSIEPSDPQVTTIIEKLLAQ